MKIIIAGDGKVDATLTRQKNCQRGLRRDHYRLPAGPPPGIQCGAVRRDLRSGAAAHPWMLLTRQAGVKDASLLIAATGADE